MGEGNIATAGGNIWYSAYGGGKQKTPLLVLHGGPGFLSMTDGLAPLWADRPVYFYDQLGCGNSDRAAADDYYSVARYVSELAEVRAALDAIDDDLGPALESWHQVFEALQKDT